MRVTSEYMTKKDVDVSVKLFTVSLIIAFVLAFKAVLGMFL